ncbi:MerR family transcriptional regulator [Flavobacterium kingsejongi]|uniref:MerR family transcriptional regulator n=1 Tax=Flavobacterium kingsejongi TaxID=1678728 RepID=A0A2S1LTQ1_9FLAO|nr:MerR family transcriptional regulator [Flavobacterium kingsejongi]AWG27119.1 MerR family transcriptional regulator [Flavobacterium kingsejongi]
MNNSKNVFSIKDLENLSGIKAHTIRIWEKRYAVLEPMRTDNNVRYYDLPNVQKLLNITLLHNHGYKISQISKYPPEKIPQLVQEIITNKNFKGHTINAFKIAMLNFDQNLFVATYEELLGEKCFREIFTAVFIPLLNEIGMLWQAGTITPAHEHFITNLIRQKLMVNIDLLQAQKPTVTSNIFVFYLPKNEIHELGLLYLNYEALNENYQTIYLGCNVSIEDLKSLKEFYDNIIFTTYMTTEPSKEEVNTYIGLFASEILNDTNSQLWVMGRMTNYLKHILPSDKIAVLESIPDFLNKL